MSFCTPEEIRRINNIKPNHFNLKKEDEDGLNIILSEWISEAEDMIQSYCKRKFENVPLSVKNVCIRLVSNMVAFSVLRRDSPIIKVNDWKVEFVGSDIFTKDLKEDLKPFLKRSNKIACFSL